MAGKRKSHQETEKEFKFKKRGELNTREMKELTKTHRSLASWMQPLSKNCKEVTQDMVEDMEGETRDREERVEIASSEKASREEHSQRNRISTPLGSLITLDYP